MLEASQNKPNVQNKNACKDRTKRLAAFEKKKRAKNTRKLREQNLKTLEEIKHLTEKCEQEK